MIRRIKQNTPQIEETIAKAVNFEIQVADIGERDQRRSWLVAFMSIFLCCILALSYFLLFPLSKVQRYIITIDPLINVGQLHSLEDDKAFLNLVSREAVLKRSVTDYIRARESYDWPSMYYTDYPKIMSMSSPEAVASFNALYSTDNPKNPRTEYGQEKALRVDFTNTELRRIGDPEDMVTEAVVRFHRFVYTKNGATTTYKDSKIATVRFTFDRNLLWDPTQQTSNPLGFRVMNYRVDNDNSPPPPPPDFVPKDKLQSESEQSGQSVSIPQIVAPLLGGATSAEPQPQNPAQPADQPQSAPPAGQAPNQVNGVRN
jgi:type IV secretion system protein VirB8